MTSFNNQCDYAVYAEADAGVENHNYIDLDLPLGLFFNYYPKTLEYDEALDKLDPRPKDYVHLGMTQLDGTFYDETYYRERVLPLFPADWREKLPKVSTLHLIYNVDLNNDKSYSASKMYACVYLEALNLDLDPFDKAHYIRLDYYLGIDTVPAIPDAGTDIYFLFGLGQSIFSHLSTGDVLNRLLGIEINGLTFVEILFSGGIIVYCSWTVIKWVIGLS